MNLRAAAAALLLVAACGEATRQSPLPPAPGAIPEPVTTSSTTTISNHEVDTSLRNPFEPP